ncbi:MAG: GntR family transcriptional regulator [Pseudomonadota bacterium]
MAKRADALRDALEEEILIGRLRPGERLEEPALAARFGVSRTPIREALSHLAAAGLIEARPHRGAVVAEIGPVRLMEMFEVMAELEAMAAARAARRASAADLDALSRAHAACAEAAAADDGDAYYYANEHLHALIRTAARNAFLIEQADALQKRLKPYRRLQLRARDRLRTSHAEHGAILAAIGAGEAERAGQTMRAHVAVQGERFADLLASLAAAGE